MSSISFRYMLHANSFAFNRYILFHLRKIVVSLLINWQWINRWLRWISLVFQLGNLWGKHSHCSFCIESEKWEMKRGRKLMTFKKIDKDESETKLCSRSGESSSCWFSLVRETRIQMTSFSELLCSWLREESGRLAHTTHKSTQQHLNQLLKNMKNLCKWKGED